MIEARTFHTATVLSNGTVIAAGGASMAGSGDALSSAELYDPSSESWTAIGTMMGARAYHTATLLPDGTVLVAGGTTSSGSGDALASAELYDPISESWTAIGTMMRARAYHTATLLPDGTVLVAGGTTSGVVQASAELYDPGTGSWTATKNMVGVRSGHTATLLPDGTVLVAGGSSSATASGTVASAELYDPSSGSWTATGTMVEARSGHTATLLPDGTVLVAGGIMSSYLPSPVASAELYDPSSESWTATGNMDADRAFHTATLLPDGKVLVAGAFSTGIDALVSAELYDPSTGEWTVTGDMDGARAGHTATLLPDGEALLAGGVNLNGTADALASAQLYDPGSAT